MPERDDHPASGDLKLGPILAALSDPLRRQVIAELARGEDGGERTCASFGLPVSKASLTHHFKVMREAGLIRQVDHGNRKGTTLRRADLDHRFPGLIALIAAE